MILFVHGYEGSAPGHWQRWLAAQLEARGVPHAFPELPAPFAPELDAWVAAVEFEVRRSREPVVFVAHSLGCWCVDHFLDRNGPEGIRAALLVSPPAPDLDFEPIRSFLPPPRNSLAWAPIAGASLLLGSDEDPYAGPGVQERIATELGVSYRCVIGGGHLNIASGFGPFPLAADWVLRAIRAVTP